MPTRTSKKLTALSSRIYNAHMKLIKKLKEEGKKICDEIYVLTPEDYEILRSNKEFRMLDENVTPPFKRPFTNLDISSASETRPNIGGYEVIRDETIAMSMIEYTIYNQKGERLRERTPIEYV